MTIMSCSINGEWIRHLLRKLYLNDGSFGGWFCVRLVSPNPVTANPLPLVKCGQIYRRIDWCTSLPTLPYRYYRFEGIFDSVGTVVFMRKKKIKKQIHFSGLGLGNGKRARILGGMGVGGQLRGSMDANNPPKGASGQQLVVKGTSPTSRWAPKVPNCPQAPEPLPSVLELGVRKT